LANQLAKQLLKKVQKKAAGVTPQPTCEEWAYRDANIWYALIQLRLRRKTL